MIDPLIEIGLPDYIPPSSLHLSGNDSSIVVWSPCFSSFIVIRFDRIITLHSFGLPGNPTSIMCKTSQDQDEGNE